MSQHNKVKNFFEQYRVELKQFVYNKVSDSGEAEDLVQDAFHNLLRQNNIDAIDNPRAYLYRAATNLAHNLIRSRRVSEAYFAEKKYAIEDEVSPERNVVAQTELELIHATLDKMPEKCRQAFILSRVKHLTYREISLEMNVAESTVEKYIIRALKELRHAVDRGEK